MASAKSPLPQPPNALDLEKRKNEHDDTVTPSDGDEPESNRNANQEQEQDQEWLSGLKLFTIMAAVTFVCFLVLLDSSIVATAIPRITNEFHSLPDIGWYGAAYQLGRYAVWNFSRNRPIDGTDILVAQSFNHLPERFIQNSRLR